MRLGKLVRIAAALLFVVGSGLALASDKSAPDLDGSADLIVRREMLEAQWLVRVENLPASYCSVVEGEVTPGDRKLLRFTVGTANIGNADIFIGNPRDHVDANDGLFEYSSCHQHFHFRHYALYELVDPATGHVWRAAKRGFCMLDTDPNPAYLGAPPHAPYYNSCGDLTSGGRQGISVGWTDTYRFDLGGQYFVLDGGDGQAPVPPGHYIIRITVDPPFTPQTGEACPHRDSRGFCHQLPESNYDNNVGEVAVDIPANPGRSGVGPLAGTPPAAESSVYP